MNLWDNPVGDEREGLPVSFIRSQEGVLMVDTFPPRRATDTERQLHAWLEQLTQELQDARQRESGYKNRLRRRLKWGRRERQRAEKAESHERKLQRRITELLSGKYGFVGHVDGCRIQLGRHEDCTCGFSVLSTSREET